jgi:hypothetical protein
MIVKDKEATLKVANEIVAKMISLMSEEVKKFKCDDDPAEQIYLVTHIIAIMTSKVSMLIEGYGKTYGIENLTCDEAYSWIDSITEEIISNNKGKYL